MGTIIILLVGIVILVVLIAVIGKTSIKALTAGPESQDARRNLWNFAIGFFGWPVLNAILVLFLGLLVLPIVCIGDPGPGPSGVGGCGFVATFYGLVLIVLVNIGILIIILVRRRWWIVSGILSVAASLWLCVVIFSPLFYGSINPHP